MEKMSKTSTQHTARHCQKSSIESTGVKQIVQRTRSSSAAVTLYWISFVMKTKAIRMLVETPVRPV